MRNISFLLLSFIVFVFVILACKNSDNQSIKQNQNQPAITKEETPKSKTQDLEGRSFNLQNRN